MSRPDNEPPLHPLPWLYSPYQEFSDEQALAILDFLYELANAFGNRYFDQLHRASRQAEKQFKRARGKA